MKKLLILFFLFTVPSFCQIGFISATIDSGSVNSDTLIIPVENTIFALSIPQSLSDTVYIYVSDVGNSFHQLYNIDGTKYIIQPDTSARTYIWIPNNSLWGFRHIYFNVPTAPVTEKNIFVLYKEDE